MIESTIISYLGTKLGISVTAETPKNKTEYVVIQKVDGGISNHIKAATISFKCVSTTLFKAAQLCSDVEDAIYGIPELNEISGVELASSSQAIDTSTKTYAYECMFNFYYY